MNAQKIGNVISELREAKGMTQAQLAQRLNVSDKAISKLCCRRWSRKLKMRNTGWVCKRQKTSTM